MHFMKKSLFPLVLFLLVSATGGCLLTTLPYRSSNTYDLRAPGAAVPAPVDVQLFENDSPARTRMLYRETGNQILTDEYNTWVQQPEQMLKRYLSKAFPQSGTTQVKELIRLEGSVLVFEIDLVQNAAILQVHCSLTRGSKQWVGIIGKQVPFTQRNPEAFAEAMSQAADQLARELASIMQREFGLKLPEKTQEK